MGFFYAPDVVSLVSVQPKRNRHIRFLTISLLATLFVSVPVAYLAAPHLRRWTRIHSLTSADLDLRQRGLSYLAMRAGEDDRVLAGAVSKLEIEDDENFQQIVSVLQATWRWERTNIPDDPWLRWIGLLADEPNTEAGCLAAQRLAYLHDLADDRRVVDMLEALIVRDEPDVRYNALCAVAELTMSAVDRSPYELMIAGRTADAEPLIAQHAWLFRHYLDMPIDDAPARLTEAIKSSQRPYTENRRFTLKEIRALLLSPESKLRDVGCVLAVRDLKENELDALIAELLGDMNDQAMMSGAILSGMTGLHTDKLQRQADFSNDWTVNGVSRLALFTLDRAESGTGPSAGWYIANDLPRSTVIFVMLYREETRWQGLDVLLNPRGEPPGDLPGLLDDYNWWRVLNATLPPTAPHWQPDTPLDTQRFQVDMLRDWYLVHRKQIMDGP